MRIYSTILIWIPILLILSTSKPNYLKLETGKDLSNFCTPTAVPYNNWIARVELNNLIHQEIDANNPLGNGKSASTPLGYGDFRSGMTIPDLSQGNTELLKVTGQFNWQPGTAYIKAWIDLNGDLDFDDPGEEVASVSGTFPMGQNAQQVFNINMPIPPSAPIGNTIIRIGLINGNTPTSCGNSAWNGEFEDYTVNIISSGSNPNPPSVNLTTNNTSVSAPFTVTATFDQSVTGMTETDFSVTNGTTSNFTGSGTTYSVTVTPTNAGNVTIQIPADVAQNANGDLNTASNLLTVNYTPPSGGGQSTIYDQSLATFYKTDGTQINQGQSNIFELFNTQINSYPPSSNDNGGGQSWTWPDLAGVVDLGSIQSIESISIYEEQYNSGSFKISIALPGQSGYNEGAEIYNFNLNNGTAQWLTHNLNTPINTQYLFITRSTSDSKVEEIELYISSGSGNGCSNALNVQNTIPICDDNGTTNDSSDDTYSFDITVTGGDGSYEISYSGYDINATSGIPVSISSIPISIGNLNISIDDLAGCTENITVNAPSTCSTGNCLLTISNSQIYNANGTLANGSGSALYLFDQQPNEYPPPSSQTDQDQTTTWTYPLVTYIDMGEEKVINGISIFDGYGDGMIKIHSGKPNTDGTIPNNAELIAEFRLNIWPLAWVNQTSLSTSPYRYLTIERTGINNSDPNDAKIRELAICTGSSPEIYENYHELSVRLGSPYALSQNDKLQIHYIEKYFISPGINDIITCKIFDKENTFAISNNRIFQYNNTYGENWKIIDLSGASLTSNEYYILEVTGINKNETKYLRFKYN